MSLWGSSSLDLESVSVLQILSRLVQVRAVGQCWRRPRQLLELLLAFFVLWLLWFEVDGCAEAWGAPDREVRWLLFF